jgi:hypothetical protein
MEYYERCKSIIGGGRRIIGKGAPKKKKSHFSMGVVVALTTHAAYTRCTAELEGER